MKMLDDLCVVLDATVSFRYTSDGVVCRIDTPAWAAVRGVPISTESRPCFNSCLALNDARERHARKLLATRCIAHEVEGKPS